MVDEIAPSQKAKAHSRIFASVLSLFLSASAQADSGVWFIGLGAADEIWERSDDRVAERYCEATAPSGFTYDFSLFGPTAISISCYINSGGTPFRVSSTLANFQACDPRLDFGNANQQSIYDQYCPASQDKNIGSRGSCIGNPCNPATGNKFQSETDLKLSGLSFIRSYNSKAQFDGPLGFGWVHNHQRRLVISTDAVLVIDKDGRGEQWTNQGGVWQGDNDTNYALEQTADGYRIENENGKVELFDAAGRLLDSQYANTQSYSYTYDAQGLLTRVENNFGLALTFEYTNGRIIRMNSPVGEFNYEYDVSGNLVSVVYPDTTPTDTNDNPSRAYLYEKENLSNNLTGIVDENGDRYATFAYDAQGRAVLSEHAQTSNIEAQEKFELSYE